MKFLLASWGSSGDLHPFLALARELRRRGHEATMVGMSHWKQSFLDIGIDFVSVGPPLSPGDLLEHPEIISTKNFGLTSFQSLINLAIVPMIDEGLRTLCKLAPEHDALLAHHFFLPAGAAAEKAQIPWATISLSPSIFPSRYSLPSGQAIQPFRGPLGRIANQGAWKLAKMMLRPYIDPIINAQRQREGLAPITDTAFESVSRTLNLALYSQSFSPRMADYHESIHLTGFCPWEPDFTAPPDLTAFLDTGDKPYLFTLGTSAIANPGDFYRNAVDGLRGQKERAILLIGDKRNLPASLPPNVLALDYAPHHWIMPRCRAVAHHCGMGTSAAALRAGIPSVACPYAFDQPHNAMCLEAAGVAIHLATRKRSGSNLFKTLRQVGEGAHAQRAREIGEKLRAENGPATVCTLLEKTFHTRPRPAEARIFGFIEGLAIL